VRVRSYSEGDFAVLELVLVFRVDIHIGDIGQFLLFDLQDLVTFVLDLLARLLPFFEVIKSSLLGNFRVLTDLVTDAFSVVSESCLSLLLDSFLLLFVSLLLGDNGQEFFSRGSGLSSISGFSILELLEARNFEILNDLSFMSCFSGFTLSLLTLVFFTGTFSSKSIDISLSIGGSFLKFTESLDLILLLLGNTLGFSDDAFFGLSSLALVFQDFIFHTPLFSLLLLFEIKGLSVRCLNFVHHLDDGYFLVSLLLFFNLVLLSDVGQELESLLLSHFLLTHAETFTLLDLVNNDFSALILGDLATSLALFLLLEIL